MSKKKLSSRLLSLILCLLLLVTAIPFAGIVSVSAKNTGLDVYLVGGMTGWGSLEEFKFVEEGNGIYSYVWDMTGGVYECKIFTGNWGTSIGADDNDDNNIIFDVDTDTVMKITANVNNRSYTAVKMDTKSDFTLGTSATTIEAEKYSYALGAVKVLSDSKASAQKYVGDFDKGDALNFGVTVSEKAPVTYRFEINVASETEAGDLAFTVRSTNEDGVFEKIVGKDVYTASFAKTGGWQSYKTLVLTATLNPGYNRITLENLGGTYNVDKIVATAVKDFTDTVAKGETSLDFSGYDSASDTALVKDGKVTDLDLNECVSVIVKPEQDGVYTVSLDETAAKNGNLAVFTRDYKNFAVITEEDPTAEFVIDGLTEIFVVSYEDDAAVSKINFSYIENVEQMGYVFYEDGYAGIRFANTFAVDEIIINAYDEVKAGKLYFSDGTYVDVDAISGRGEKVVKLSTPKNVTWIKYESDTVECDLKVKGVKDSKSATDIALQGYVSSPYGWIPTVDAAYTDLTATEGKVGFGFDNEVTVDKVVFVGLAGVEAVPNPTEPSEPATTVPETDPATSTEATTVPTTSGVVDVKQYLLGDADQNEKVNIKDATIIQKHVAKIVELTGDAIICADTTADDKVNIKDATAIQKYVAMIDIPYPIGEMITLSDGEEVQLVAVGADVPAEKTETAPLKATLTTADNKKTELTGKVVGNDVVFEDINAYSFGFFFDFGQQIDVNAIQVYGDATYNGGSVNVSDAQDYSLFVNGLTENDSRVIANTGNYILTTETGSDREWTFNLDAESYGYDYPSFYAPNTPLAEVAYNLTMKEIYNSIRDTDDGDVFYTGTGWAKVWTRDTAMSMQYILSWLFPEISTNCAYAKVVGTDGNLTFEEDTGTGGSYPVSTDRIIMMLAVWETYLADGNTENLEYFYEVASNTIMQDYEVVYDKEAGLFRGETCGLDHRDKTYGDWTGEDDENGIVTIAEGKAANTNIIFCQVMKILADTAEILGKDEAEAKAWDDLAADLEKAISDRLWHDELGTYTSWEYPDWMGSPIAYKQDVLADGYAVWYNIGGQEKADSIMENHTLVPFGANTVYPNKNAQRWTDYKYHDSGVWPGWEAILMIGAVNNENENNLLAEEIWNSCIRGAVSCLTNYEVIDYESGRGLHSTNQLWSVAATMAGYYRVLFGMEYTTEGITFDPYVPEWMDGPFYAGNYKYRDAVLDLELIGRGDTVAEMYVNGEKVANDYVLPTNAKGEYSIKIVLSDSGAEDIINLKAENTAKAPNAPNRVTLSGGKLTWNAVNNCTYKVWTGTEYVDVDTTSYTIDTTKYGVYSVVAVDKTTGIWSELSAPKEYNPTGTKVTVNANNYYDKSPAVSGAVDNENTKTVYFTNNKGWSTVNIFFWGGSTEAGWPGEAMNYVGKNEGGEDVYCYSIPKDTPNIIFNNGSEQTVDITTGVEDNAGFYLDKNNGKWTVGTWTNETFKPSDGAGAAGGFTTKVTIPSDGVYQLSVIHSNQGDPTAGITAAIRSVYIDGEDVGSLVFPAMSFTKQTSSHLRLELTKGEHEITIKYDTDNWFDRNMSQAHGGRDNNVTYHTIQFARTGDIVEKPIVTLVTGDADGDSKVNVKDATAIQKHVAGLITLTADGVKAADVDANTQVNVKDATAIQKHIAGIDTGFDIEKPFEK